MADQPITWKVSKALVRYNFYEWWDRSYADRAALFEMVNAVREHVGLKPFTYEEFDKGWQYRNVFQVDYVASRSEMIDLCLGCW